MAQLLQEALGAGLGVLMGWWWDNETQGKAGKPRAPRGAKGPSGKRVDCLPIMIGFLVLAGAVIGGLGYTVIHLI